MDEDAARRAVRDFSPDVIIDTVAYMVVDRAETYSEL
jgi:dTDP-4-dehydrorhamnose reductase